VNLKSILVSLIDRLANFANSGEKIPSDIDVFKIFQTKIAEVVEKQTSVPLEDILALHASLLNLSIICYPTNLDNVDQIFKFCADLLKTKEKEAYSGPACVKQIQRLLNVPLETFKNILTVLKLQNYPSLLVFLSYENRKKVAIDIARTSVEYNVSLPNGESLNNLLELVKPLVKDEDDQPANATEDEEFAEEQNLVASLIHLCESDNLEELFGMYLIARKHFGQGGPKRIKHSLPPLVFRGIKLVLRLKSTENEDSDWGKKAGKVFKFIHETVSALVKGSQQPQLCLNLFLQCALAANKCGPTFETMCYEFMSQALVIYEEQISQSQLQFNIVITIIGTLQRINIFGEENYDTLVTKTALHSSKLLKKSDQCRAVYMCSHLFWRVGAEAEFKNGKRVLECLQKALKIADTCMDSSMNVQLFVEILNEFLYFFESNCENVTLQYLTGLIALINTNLASVDNSSQIGEAINAHYLNTQYFIKWKKETDPRYSGLDI